MHSKTFNLLYKIIIYLFLFSACGNTITQNERISEYNARYIYFGVISILNGYYLEYERKAIEDSVFPLPPKDEDFEKPIGNLIVENKTLFYRNEGLLTVVVSTIQEDIFYFTITTTFQDYLAGGNLSGNIYCTINGSGSFRYFRTANILELCNGKLNFNGIEVEVETVSTEYKVCGNIGGNKIDIFCD